MHIFHKHRNFDSSDGADFWNIPWFNTLGKRGSQGLQLGSRRSLLNFLMPDVALTGRHGGLLSPDVVPFGYWQEFDDTASAVLDVGGASNCDHGWVRWKEEHMVRSYLYRSRPDPRVHAGQKISKV